MSSKISKLIILIFLAGCANCAMAQNIAENHSNLIFVSPIRAIDPINPGLEIGYQRSYEGKWASLISVSRMMPIISANFAYSNYKGWRYQAEQKYFLKRSWSPIIRTYLAIDLAYMKVDYYDDMTFAADTGRNTPIYWENIHIHKTRLAGNVKYGFQIPLKHFVFDFVGGVGLVYRKVINSGLSNPKADYRYSTIDFNIPYKADLPGNEVIPNIAFDIRIAYSF